MKRRKKLPQQRLADINLRQYAAILSSRHGKEWKKKLEDRYDIVMNHTEAQFEQLIGDTLMAYWKRILKLSLIEGHEIFWATQEHGTGPGRRPLFWLRMNDNFFVRTRLMKGRLKDRGAFILSRPEYFDNPANDYKPPTRSGEGA